MNIFSRFMVHIAKSFLLKSALLTGENMLSFHFIEHSFFISKVKHSFAFIGRFLHFYLCLLSIFLVHFKKYFISFACKIRILTIAVLKYF